MAAGGAALAFGLEACGEEGPGPPGPFGPLVADPEGLLDLPAGFRYAVLSSAGSRLSSGAPVPGNHDGMVALKGAGGVTVLVRNHELRAGELGGAAVEGRAPYNAGEPGGTTAVVLDPDRTEVDSYVTSSGTRRNCAGGRTPWRTWLTCEEDLTGGHGYVFEVLPWEREGRLSRTPIRDMGHFSHEAVAIDPGSGIAYLTEDDSRGEVADDPREDTQRSFLYRYVPHDRRRRPGALQRGGRLEVLTLEERPSSSPDLFRSRQRFGVVWKEVRPQHAHDDALGRGATAFNRLEGAAFAGGAVWFTDTVGGERRLGQVYRYLPASDTLELFFEGRDETRMQAPDNVVVTPWGDLWFGEDGERSNRVMGITPDGAAYEFARYRGTDSELAGPCFSPDGGTFFVNAYDPGMTFAVWGPFGRRDTGERRRMSAASPPPGLGPRIDPRLAEAAERHGLSRLEAAAYHRLGVPLP